MPFTYAHITWTDSPEAVANQLEKWAEYLRKDAEQLRKNLKQDLYSKPANDQMQIQHENPEGWRDKSIMLLEIVDDLEELQKLREKIHVVELKTKAEQWDEWAVTQKPLYTKEAIQKLPDDMIYEISTYLGDELSLTENVGGLNGSDAFRSTWWRGCVQVEFVTSVTNCLNIWSIDAIKMFWVKNVLPKMTFVHACDLQNQYQTSGTWDDEETNGWYRAFLFRAIMKWNKAKLIENFTKLFSIQADTNCSFKFQIEWRKEYSGIAGVDYTAENRTYNQKFFVTINNYSENIICNKDMYHIIKAIKWVHTTKIDLHKYKNKDMKNVDTFYPINPDLYLQPGHLDQWEWDELHNKYIEQNPNFFRVAYSRGEMLHLDKVVPRVKLH